MRNKLLAIFMSLAIAVCFMPTFAFAEPVEGEDVEAPEIEAEVTEADDYLKTADLRDGVKAWNKDGQIDAEHYEDNGIFCAEESITLQNAQLTELQINSNSDIAIVLKGTNEIVDADKDFLYGLYLGSNTGNPTYTIMGSGELNVTASTGIRSDNADLVIAGGTINVTANGGENQQLTGIDAEQALKISGGKIAVKLDSNKAAVGICGSTVGASQYPIEIIGGDVDIDVSGKEGKVVGLYGYCETNISCDRLNINAKGEKAITTGLFSENELTINCKNLKINQEDSGGGEAILSRDRIRFTGGNAEISGSYRAVMSTIEAGITLENGLVETHGYSVKSLPIDNPNLTTFVTDGKNTDAKAVTIKRITSSADSFRATASGKKAIQLAWPVMNDADKYIVYGAKCGKKYSKVAEVTATNYKVTKIKGKSLKKKTAYKFYLQAVKGGKVVSTTYGVHAFTTGYKGRYGNVKSITAKTKSMSVAVGKTSKKAIKVKTKRVKGKRLMPKSHGPQYRYVSSNPAVAKATKKGKIKGVSNGTATIYTYTINGFFCKTAVKVGTGVAPAPKPEVTPESILKDGTVTFIIDFDSVFSEPERRTVNVKNTGEKMTTDNQYFAAEITGNKYALKYDGLNAIATIDTANKTYMIQRNGFIEQFDIVDILYNGTSVKHFYKEKDPD